MSTFLGFGRTAGVELKGRIMLAIGLIGGCALGCGDSSSTGEAGGQVGGEGQGAGDEGGSGEGGADDGAGAGGASDGGAAAGGAPQGGAGEGGAAGEANVERCFLNANGPDAECPTLEQAPRIYQCTDNGEYVTAWLSGPVGQDGQCCYMVDVTAPNDVNCGAVGRPLIVEERAHRARPKARTGRGGWSCDLPSPSVADLTAFERGALAKAWAEEAAYEHASVASFAKFALELLAFGAPAELVRLAHEAALDEVRHAQLGFALASGYAGVTLEPGELAAARHVTFAASVEELIDALVVEGCVGETVAAWLASAQLEVARDAAVCAALVTISGDEGRHAELAWRSLRWALSIGGEPGRARARSAFERAIAATERAELPAADASHAHGRLSSEEIVRERQRALDELVRPSMRALLG